MEERLWLMAKGFSASTKWSFTAKTAGVKYKKHLLPWLDEFNLNRSLIAVTEANFLKIHSIIHSANFCE